MKKLTEFRFAKKVLFIYMMFVAASVLFLWLWSAGAYGIGFLTSRLIPEAIEVTFNIDDDISAPIMIIAVIIKVLDYIFTVINYEDKTDTVRYTRFRHKVFNVLGLIALPAWIVTAGLFFYGCCWLIADQLLSVEILKVLFVVPTVLIFACSLSLDVFGLKAKSAQASPKE